MVSARRKRKGDSAEPPGQAPGGSSTDPRPAKQATTGVYLGLLELRSPSEGWFGSKFAEQYVFFWPVH